MWLKDWQWFAYLNLTLPGPCVSDSCVKKKIIYLKLIKNYFKIIYFHIFTFTVQLLSISEYSVQMRENADQNNSEYGYFLHSVFKLANLWKM